MKKLSDEVKSRLKLLDSRLSYRVNNDPYKTMLWSSNYKTPISVYSLGLLLQSKDVKVKLDHLKAWANNFDYLYLTRVKPKICRNLEGIFPMFNFNSNSPTENERQDEEPKV